MSAATAWFVVADGVMRSCTDCLPATNRCTLPPPPGSLKVHRAPSPDDGGADAPARPDLPRLRRSGADQSPCHLRPWSNHPPQVLRGWRRGRDARPGLPFDTAESELLLHLFGPPSYTRSARH